jgi:hypothetical protein
MNKKMMIRNSFPDHVLGKDKVGSGIKAYEKWVIEHVCR